MPNFAIIEDNIVTNIIVAESKAIAEEVTGKICVEYTDVNPAGIGFIYNETTFEQAQPEELPVE